MDKTGQGVPEQLVTKEQAQHVYILFPASVFYLLDPI